MRISDWSSDVCSSDLRELSPPTLRRQGRVGEGCRWHRREPTPPSPNLPLPSQGEEPGQKLAAEAAPAGAATDVNAEAPDAAHPAALDARTVTVERGSQVLHLGAWRESVQQRYPNSLRARTAVTTHAGKPTNN